MTGTPPASTRRLSTGVAVTLTLLVAALPLGPASAGTGEGAAWGEVEGTAWAEVLERAAEAARDTPYQGETLLLGRDGKHARMTKVRVRNTPEHGLEVGAAEGLNVRITANGGGLYDGGEQLVAPLPPVDFGGGDDFGRLGSKYDLVFARADRVMDRPCTMLEIRRRADGALRERLWVDDESGLLVRRETFEGGDEPVRLATYLSLDLDPEQRSGPHAPAEAAEASELLVPEGQGMEALDERGLAALRESGWTVPGGLPDGYAPLGAYAVDAGTSQPLQLVFGDGLYVVSVFQQQGRPDWSSLPPGAQRVEALDFPAYEWPGAVPHRLVWEAEGRTFTLVSDAPAVDLVRIAEALPQPQVPGVLERLGRGLGRLLSFVTPWG